MMSVEGTRIANFGSYRRLVVPLISIIRLMTITTRPGGRDLTFS